MCLKSQIQFQQSFSDLVLNSSQTHRNKLNLLEKLSKSSILELTKVPNVPSNQQSDILMQHRQDSIEEQG